MATIKSNSVLMAFDYSVYSENNIFKYLNFIQSISYDIKTNRINHKSIGSDVYIKSQFTKPEIETTVTYLQRSDFFNETLFGFGFEIDYLTANNSALKNILNGFYNKNAFILMSDTYMNDLALQIKNKGFNSEMLSISLGNTYLKSYSFGYRIGEMPTATASFVSSDLKISKISYDGQFKLNNWSDNLITLDENVINNFLTSTNENLNKNITYHMRNLSFQNDFDMAEIPGPNISTFLNGLIQSIDFNIDINRNNYYFFQSGNSPVDRNIIYPLIGKIRISGISKDIITGNFDYFFNSDKKFTMTLLVGEDATSGILKATSNYYDIVFNDLTVENFSYTFDLNNFLVYSIECSVQITPSQGFNIKRKYTLENINILYSSDSQMLTTFEQNNSITLTTAV